MTALSVHGLPSSSRSGSCSCGCSSEVERLRDRVEKLEKSIGLKVVGWPVAGMSAMEWQMAQLLLRRQRISRESAFDAIYGSHHESDQPESLRVIDTIVCRMRKRLRGYGITVKNVWHEGYYLDADSRSRLKELVDGPGHG